MDNILATEEELLHALPKKGLALLNANNPYVQKLLKKTKKNVLLYGTTVTKKGKANSIIAKNVHVERNGISFTVEFHKKLFHLHTPLLGGHHVENILPAVYLAHYLGMKERDITNAVLSLTPLPKTMKKFTTQEGVILIDDSFNASPESVVAAATYLTTYSHKKIFVLMPLIELGKKAKEYHYHIGEVLASNDYLFLTNKNFYKDIRQGIHKKNGKCKVYVMTPDKISQRISEITKKGDVVLFEGKEAGNVLTKLL
jgi:UDP-N-acetylmuramoyl-tripeptide--D-alanyl-D-alanine ligase